MQEGGLFGAPVHIASEKFGDCSTQSKSHAKWLAAVEGDAIGGQDVVFRPGEESTSMPPGRTRTEHSGAAERPLAARGRCSNVRLFGGGVFDGGFYRYPLGSCGLT